MALGVNRRGREVTSCVVKPTELQGEAVELTRDEQVLKTIVDNITSGREPRPITISHSGGPVRCRDHISRDELMEHFQRHAINATRAHATMKNAFSRAWLGLARKFGNSVTDGVTGRDSLHLSIDYNNLGII